MCVTISAFRQLRVYNKLWFLNSLIRSGKTTSTYLECSLNISSSLVKSKWHTKSFLNSGDSYEEDLKIGGWNLNIIPIFYRYFKASTKWFCACDPKFRVKMKMHEIWAFKSGFIICYVLWKLNNCKFNHNQKYLIPVWAGRYHSSKYIFIKLRWMYVNQTTK